MSKEKWKEIWSMVWQKSNVVVTVVMHSNNPPDEDISSFHDMMLSKGWRCTFNVDDHNTVKIYPDGKSKKKPKKGLGKSL